jgi:hypothetical protein
LRNPAAPGTAAGFGNGEADGFMRLPLDRRGRRGKVVISDAKRSLLRRFVHARQPEWANTRRRPL